MKTFIIIMLSFLCCGCYTKKQALARFCVSSSTVKDSTYHKDSSTTRAISKIQDMVIVRPPAIFNLSIPMPCDSFKFPKKYEFNQGNNKVIFELKNDLLQAYIFCDGQTDSFHSEIHTRDSIISFYKSQIKEKDTTKIITNEPSFWDKIKSTFFDIMLFLAGIVIGYIIKFIW